MLAVGRKRAKGMHLPAGVQEKRGVWYWEPTSARERAERRLRRNETGEPVSVTLGPARSEQARRRWAEVSGFNDIRGAEGTVLELLHLWKRDGLKKRPNGQPRADSTIEMYGRSIPVLERRFGACQYGKTEFEASRGQAVGTAEIQRFVAESAHLVMANRHLAVLDNVFAHAIRVGRTTYNPCADAVKNFTPPREREALVWEVECLLTLARPALGLLMEFEAITGWRIGDILKLRRSSLTPEGIRVQHRKGGQRTIWEWTPELRRIVEEAQVLAGASPFPASPVFPNRKGRQISYPAFDDQWQKLKRLVNEELADGIIDLGLLRAHGALEILDLHFHDLRSKAHDDAEDEGRAGHELLGNTEAVADRHYQRREQRRRPLR